MRNRKLFTTLHLEDRENIRVSPKRAKAYQEYLKSPKGRIEAILDEMDEHRLKSEISAAKRFAYHGFARLARRALRS